MKLARKQVEEMRKAAQAAADGQGPDHEQNFFVACSPERVLALFTALEAERDHWRRTANGRQSQAVTAREERDKLRIIVRRLAGGGYCVCGRGWDAIAKAGHRPNCELVTALAKTDD